MFVVAGATGHTGKVVTKELLDRGAKVEVIVQSKKRARLMRIIIPVVGHVIILGPLVSRLIGDLEGAAVAGGTGALFAALVGLGIPKDSVVQYENEVKAGRLVVLAQGTTEEVARGREILAGASATIIAQHG